MRRADRAELNAERVRVGCRRHQPVHRQLAGRQRSHVDEALVEMDDAEKAAVLAAGSIRGPGGRHLRRSDRGGGAVARAELRAPLALPRRVRSRDLDLGAALARRQPAPCLGVLWTLRTVSVVRGSFQGCPPGAGPRFDTRECPWGRFLTRALSPIALARPGTLVRAA